MFVYEKRLQYPIKIKQTNPKLAKIIITQYGGPDGELGASLRYLSQRYTMPFPELQATLTDIGTEELGHLEMIGTIVYQLTKDLTEDQLKDAGFDAYFVDHTTGVYPCDANGTPYTTASMQVKGDAITDLHEDMAAEQKARSTYDNILRFCDDPDVIDPIRFLREREVVHYQRFGENLRILTDRLDCKNFYAFNPEFDKNCLNIAKIPHMLIGGSTGSGKSVLLKLVLMQCIKKGAEVYIADFKGGVDFPPVWHEKCTLLTDKEALLKVLVSITNELKERKQILRNAGVANIDEYNRNTRDNLKRIVFSCDEIAEILDKTGLVKQQKDEILKIESELSVIARQGRAFGIHLILATQRPDANILSGQIRNNIDTRICGRADNVLSQIILDSTDASEQITKSSQGRFLTNSGKLFQAYWFDENNL